MKDLFEYRPLDPRNIADPYPAFAVLREIPGLYWHDGMASYVASRYDACKFVLSTSELFAKDRRRAGVDVPLDKRSVQTEDPPNRLGLRQDFRQHLHRMDLDESCRAVGDRFVERLDTVGAHFDFVRDIAYPTALDLTAAVVGLSSGQAEAYLTEHRALQRATDGGLDPDRLAEGREAGSRLHRHALGWLEGGDADGLLRPAIEFARRYPSAYTVNTLAGMVNASFTTTASFTSGVFQLLACDSVLADTTRSALASGHELTATNEFLRYLAPAQATSRVVVQDCTLDGVALHTGDTVVTLMASANRDPRAFADPDRIDPFRSPNKHLSFASGPHLCLGRRLAELWGRELLSRLTVADTLATLRAGRPEYLDSATVRSMVSLPVARL